MELRDVAERVLFGTTLEEKLLTSPQQVTDHQPGKRITMPDAPSRPADLCLSNRDERVKFPSLQHLENDQERGKIIHFLFRMGVFETLKEEQAHTLMYMRRMKECGIHFGALPVNDYFWRMVAPMAEPIDFVTRLSLTFEQANLDFSKHYGILFKKIGDNATARVLETIYKDEIEHVGHGLKWFRQWKDQGMSDWDAFSKQIAFPLTAAKAKGVAPFNADGRRAAGLDEDFITHLEISEQSRGRTPTVLLFNPNAEDHALSNITGRPFQSRKGSAHLQTDLEILPLSWCRKDDVILLDNKPSIKHIRYLKQAGFPMPEIISLTEQATLHSRKIGGLKPWAWSSDAQRTLSPLKKITTNASSIKSIETDFSGLFSREQSHLLAASDRIDEHYSTVFDNKDDLLDHLTQQQALGHTTLIKSLFSSAGRGHRKVLADEPLSKTLISKSLSGWIDKLIQQQGALITEPWLDRLLDFSAQYEITSNGDVEHLGMTRVFNDAAGRFLGCYVHSKWANGLSSNISEFLFRQEGANHGRINQTYKHDVPTALQNYFQTHHPNYQGAIGVDSMLYTAPTNTDKQGTLHIRKIVEMNPRITMGRVALELSKKSAPGKAGFYQILRKKSLGKTSPESFLDELNHGKQPTLQWGTMALNDPTQAEDFIALWHVRNNWAEIKTCIPGV